LRKSKEPDISFILGAMDSLMPWLHPGQLIVLESTTYPGTTEEVIQTRLEGKGLTVGRDAFLAFSPERVDPGNEKFTTANIPKVVGGVTPACTALAAALYANVAQRVHRVSSPRVAETAKLLENTFRSVNIALANELALACRALQVDPWEVIEAAATKPFGFMAFYPGPGLGGHCIPVDPFYLSWKARESGFEARFIELAGAVNGNMPHYVVSLVSEALNGVRKPLNGSKVLVAGVAYKKDVDDIRESPALDLLHLLHDRGCELSYTDPFVPELPGSLWANGVDLVNVDITKAAADEFDCVVIVTDHSAFNYEQMQRVAKVVVDTRNAIASPGPHVVRLGAARPNPIPELASTH
jgi:UDP-N-acetyl-D-glucosamine dehydrogenase